MTARGAGSSLHVEQRGEDLVVRLCGRLDRKVAPDILREIGGGKRSRGAVLIDLSLVEAMDSAAAAALRLASVKLRAGGMTARIVASSPVARAALSAMPAPAAAEAAPPRKPFVEQLGEGTLEWLGQLGAVTELVGQVVARAVLDPFRGRLARPALIAREAVRIGVDALPIVGLIGLLLGLIMGFQAAHQLRQFGANIFVANLVGLGMVRELGPLMTAIVLAGRSGSAIAAELGTMTVREEVDALRTMGIDPVRYLVVPKVYAITLTGPALATFSMAIGIFGGFLIALLFLDLAPGAYWGQTQAALEAGDVMHGLAKSLVFSWIVVVVSCYRGLHIRGGAEGVGRSTTSAVVASIFLIIVADSIFTTASTLMHR